MGYINKVLPFLFTIQQPQPSRTIRWTATVKIKKGKPCDKRSANPPATMKIKKSFRNKRRGSDSDGSRSKESTASGFAASFSHLIISLLYFRPSKKAMRFGDLPDWAVELARLVREAVCFGEISFKGGKDLVAEDGFSEEPCPLSFDLLWREPIFDQLIVNMYKPGEGICAHVDLMRFEDGIAIISLESACVMHFSRTEQGSITAEDRVDEEVSCTRIPVFLNPGSLILMSGDARYIWKHEINRKPGFQLWEGKEIHQQRRTSVTLRKLCPSPDQI